MATISLSLNSFYRNESGRIVLISNTVPTDHKLYKQGYRFIDTDGNFYKEDGSVRNQVFIKKDLIEEVDQKVGIGEFSDMLRERIKGMQSKREVEKKVYRFMKKALPVVSGADIGVGLMALRATPVAGMFAIGAGIAGIVINEISPDEIYVD